METAGPGLEPSGNVEQPPAPTQQQQTAHKRFQQQQAQVEAVKEIMVANVEKILQKDENISDLDGRAEALDAEAAEFGKQAAKMKRKFWWKNCKMLAILIGIGIVIIVGIVVWAVSKQQ